MPFREEFVTIFNDLVSAANQVHIVLLQKPGDNVGAKSERDAAIILTPASNIFIWIRPQQVTEQATIWDLRELAGHKGVSVADEACCALENFL